MDFNVEYDIVRQLNCIEGTTTCLLHKINLSVFLRHFNFFELLISTEGMLFIELIDLLNTRLKFF